MQLSDADLNEYVRLVLKLKPGKRKEYLAQVDRMIELMTKKVNEESVFVVKCFRKAGSLRKGTVLRPREGRAVDADVAVELDVSEADRYDLGRLHAILCELLVLVYPQKKPEDFEIQPYTLGLVFHESGLAVDLVPVIPIADEPDYAWQPSSKGEDPVKTNISGQLDFIREFSNGDPRYRTLVRLAKRWRNFKELDVLRSFTVELILAWLQKCEGPAANLEEGTLRFFRFLAQSELKDRIGFDDDAMAEYAGTEPVIVLDPVNGENNVARRITDVDRVEIVDAAREAWETLSFASMASNRTETLDLWKELFGRSFKVEE